MPGASAWRCFMFFGEYDRSWWRKMAELNDDSHRCHVLQLVGDPVGGIRKHVHKIIASLDESKFKISYAYSSRHVDAQFELDIKSLRPRMEGTIPLVISKKPHPKDILNLYRLAQYVKRKHVDIVHGHGAKAGLYARLLSRLCGVKSVYTPHGGMAHKMFNVFEDAIYKAVERWLMRDTSYFVFESQYTAASYQERVGRINGRWTVNYSGDDPVDVERVAIRSRELGYTTRDSRVFRVGIFGMLREQKGQAYAIRAIGVLVAARWKVQLHLFGDGPNKGDLQRLVRQLGLQAQIIFHGDISDAEAHMAAMDVVLIPSLFESFGYVAIEALAMNKPLVASRVGGLTEIVDENNGLLIAAGDVSAIEQALLYCMENPETMITLANCGRLKVRNKFNTSIMLANLERTYVELCV